MEKNPFSGASGEIPERGPLEGSVLYANRSEEIAALPPEIRTRMTFLSLEHPRVYEREMLYFRLGERLAHGPNPQDGSAEELVDKALDIERKDWKRNQYLRNAAIEYVIRDRIPFDVRVTAILNAVFNMDGTVTTALCRELLRRVQNSGI